MVEVPDPGGSRHDERLSEAAALITSQACRVCRALPKVRSARGNRKAAGTLRWGYALVDVHPERRRIMDREHLKGAADKAKGAMKDAAGKMTGDKRLQAEGKFDKAKGAAHNVAGDVKDAARDMSKDD
jgi:uncharacterized protein YjbJ (UPF0337 family)